MIHIAVDAMGGDYAPRHVVDGALAAVRHFDLGVLLVGPTSILASELARHADVDTRRVRIVEADEVVTMEFRVRRRAAARSRQRHHRRARPFERQGRAERDRHGLRIRRPRLHQAPRARDRRRLRPCQRLRPERGASGKPGEAGPPSVSH